MAGPDSNEQPSVVLRQTVPETYGAALPAGGASGVLGPGVWPGVVGCVDGSGGSVPPGVELGRGVNDGGGCGGQTSPTGQPGAGGGWFAKTTMPTRTTTAIRQPTNSPITTLPPRRGGCGGGAMDPGGP